MTVIPAARLTRRELLSLGNNTSLAVREDHREMHAINRSLAIHDEGIRDEDLDEIHGVLGNEWTAS